MVKLEKSKYVYEFIYRNKKYTGIYELETQNGYLVFFTQHLKYQYFPKNKIKNLKIIEEY
jgi:hypothetical protein